MNQKMPAPRKKKRRYPDVRKAGRSLIIPYDRDETPRQRHKRRFLRNLENWPLLQDWACEHGFDLLIKNHSQHWILKRGKIVAEWWPQTAKLVLDCSYREGIHTHDWAQVCALLENVLRQRGGNLNVEFLWEPPGD
jgi:hypothetical protein